MFFLLLFKATHLEMKFNHTNLVFKRSQVQFQPLPLILNEKVTTNILV